MSSKVEQLRAQLNKRILVLDGGMGTMIQSYRLSEDDFRGERFADWPCDLKGNNDLLVLSKPLTRQPSPWRITRWNPCRRR